MKSITLLLLLCAVSLRAESLQGDLKLSYSKSGFGDQGFKKEFGNVVKATTQWYAGDFFGKETVFAGINVKNTGSKPMTFNYYVAFFDKDKKLVGTTGQSAFDDDGLKPGEETQMGSCLVHLPKDKYKEIVSYQIVIYESEAVPKKK